VFVGGWTLDAAEAVCDDVPGRAVDPSTATSSASAVPSVPDHPITEVALDFFFLLQCCQSFCLTILAHPELLSQCCVDVCIPRAWCTAHNQLTTQ
jgi:hypothetical protein